MAPFPAVSPFSLPRTQVSECVQASEEREAVLAGARQQAGALLELVGELLARNNLQHLAGHVRAERSWLPRVLEEVQLGLTLLLGEMPPSEGQYQSEALQQWRQRTRDMEQRVLELEAASAASVEVCEARVTRLERELGDTAQELCEEKENGVRLQKAKEEEEAALVERMRQTEASGADLARQLVHANHLLHQEHSRVERGAEEEELAQRGREEEEVAGKARIRVAEEQRVAAEKNAEKACKNLEGIQSRLLAEIEGFKARITKAELERQTCADQTKSIECDYTKLEVLNTSLREDIVALTEAARAKAEEHVEDVHDLQRRIDSTNELVCEKDSAVRSMEVQLMEARTELELERQRSLTLGAEVQMLGKQIERLQGKMESLVRFCPRDARITVGLAHAKGETEDTEPASEAKTRKRLAESEAREAVLQRLVAEKDEEMKSLGEALRDQISTKNQELEVLSTSVERLEDEMSEVSSSMNLSSDLFAASRKTASYLESRSRHIQSLHERVARFTQENASSCEGSSSCASCEDLKEELCEAKKGVRAARGEARTERVEAARLGMQIAVMKIDLDSARDKYRCEGYGINKTQSFSLSRLPSDDGDGEDSNGGESADDAHGTSHSNLESRLEN